MNPVKIYLRIIAVVFIFVLCWFVIFPAIVNHEPMVGLASILVAPISGYFILIPIYKAYKKK